ncbi:hypothetical protein [Pseudanabaena sp. UWO310]|nr:hypothetical protein [Pseudanabaena sp. UWO310]
MIFKPVSSDIKPQEENGGASRRHSLLGACNNLLFFELKNLAEFSF